MTLVNRVSAYFLVAMAIVLGGYSLASYVLIRNHLYDELDRQLHNSLNVLVAAVEVEPDGVKWQPSDHTIDLGDEVDADDVRWCLVDERGAVVDRSRNLRADQPAETSLIDLTRAADASPDVFEAAGWRALVKRLAAPEPKPAGERDADEFSSLTVVAARNPASLRAELVRLALLVGLLPAALWIVAAVGGRAYCQRALAPVRAMADRARSIKGADFQVRLPPSSRPDELADLATAFNGLLEKLQHAFELQRRFTGDAAHQLRTPLTILRGQIDVALRRPREGAEYRETLATLRDQTESLQNIVQTLLFLARSEDPGALPAAESIELARWLPNHLRRFEDHPRRGDLVCRVEPEATVSASGDLLAQAIDNLVDNALKYSEAATPVRVTATAAADEVNVVVEDEGIGIPPQERHLVFDPFYRADSARLAGVEGTGLGLALVARIATALGGTVTCDAPSGRGAKFTLRLPRAKAATLSAGRG